MANRTFLIESASNTPEVRDVPPKIALAAGSNCIPVYWFSLFDRDCVETNQVISSTDKCYDYLCLVSSVEDAIARFSARLPLLNQITPPNLASLPKWWLEFLQNIKEPFIYLDAAELWMMIPDSFDAFIYNSLDAFDGDVVDSREGWVEMLDVAQIDLNDLAKTAKSYRLVGYSWGGQQGPWESIDD